MAPPKHAKKRPGSGQETGLHNKSRKISPTKISPEKMSSKTEQGPCQQVYKTDTVFAQGNKQDSSQTGVDSEPDPSAESSVYRDDWEWKGKYIKLEYMYKELESEFSQCRKIDEDKNEQLMSELEAKIKENVRLKQSLNSERDSTRYNNKDTEQTNIEKLREELKAKDVDISHLNQSLKNNQVLLGKANGDIQTKNEKLHGELKAKHGEILRLSQSLIDNEELLRKTEERRQHEEEKNEQLRKEMKVIVSENSSLKRSLHDREKESLLKIKYIQECSENEQKENKILQNDLRAKNNDIVSLRRLLNDKEELLRNTKSIHESREAERKTNEKLRDDLKARDQEIVSLKHSLNIATEQMEQSRKNEQRDIKKFKCELKVKDQKILDLTQSLKASELKWQNEKACADEQIKRTKELQLTLDTEKQKTLKLVGDLEAKDGEISALKESLKTSKLKMNLAELRLEEKCREQNNRRQEMEKLKHDLNDTWTVQNGILDKLMAFN